MPEAYPFTGELPLLLQLHPHVHLTDDEFFAFCQMNRVLHMERTAEGNILILPPAGGDTSGKNSDITHALVHWARKDRTGVVFDSSGGFILPNTATRSPDAAWVRRERLALLSSEQKKKFLPLCPDFVIELRSPSDRLRNLQDKMQEYLDSGARLGWLIDPLEKKVHLYEPPDQITILDEPPILKGDPVLEGFVFDLRVIWEPDF